MSKFLRPAVAEDFKGYEVQFDHYRTMDVDTKKLIEKDRILEAVEGFSKKTGMGLLQARKLCYEYQKFLNAKKDFEDGKQVFVPY